MSLSPNPAISAPISPFSGGQRRLWILSLCLLCGLLMAWQAWSARFFMNPDGVSYLDMASILLRGDASPLLHPYWSPLYPCLLAVVMRIFPGPAIEFQAAHFVNWLVGLAVPGELHVFLREYLPYRHRDRIEQSRAAFRCRTALAYGLFLWATLDAIGLRQMTPDLLWPPSSLAGSRALLPYRWRALAIVFGG